MIRDWVSSHRRLLLAVAIPVALVLTIVIFFAPIVTAVVAVFGAWTVVLGAGLWQIWDKVEKHGGKVIGALSYYTGHGRRVGLSAEMQGLINGARKEFLAEAPDAMPMPARVRFVRDDRDVAELGEGEVVVSLKDPRRHAENTARATMAYVSAAAIRPARPYVGKLVMSGVDFSLTKRFLRQADSRALDYFLNEIWEPSVQGHADLQASCDQIERIEAKGVLGRILLVEFLDFGRRLWGQNPSLAVQSEAREFVNYVAEIVDRRDNGPRRGGLEFIREHLRVGTVLVGERERAEAEGARPYIAAARWAMRAGCTSIFLLGRGARCDLVREVAAQLELDGRVRSVDLSEYLVDLGGRRVQAICGHVTVEPSARPTPPRGRHHRRGALPGGPQVAEPR